MVKKLTLTLAFSRRLSKQYVQTFHDDKPVLVILTYFKVTGVLEREIIFWEGFYLMNFKIKFSIAVT